MGGTYNCYGISLGNSTFASVTKRNFDIEDMENAKYQFRTFYRNQYILMFGVAFLVNRMTKENRKHTHTGHKKTRNSFAILIKGKCCDISLIGCASQPVMQSSRCKHFQGIARWRQVSKQSQYTLAEARISVNIRPLMLRSQLNSRSHTF